jgi:hypothetical protein
MIRDKVASTPVIDLTGPQGNAYFLMGQADRLSRQLGLDKDIVINEMKSSNYENLVQVFDRYFGDYVILER